MKKYCVVFLMFIFCSCVSGPVYIAKNESESIKRIYEDPKLQRLYDKNVDLLKDIYMRCSASHVGIAPDGIGFTPLKVFIRTTTGAKIYEAHQKQRPRQR